MPSSTDANKDQTYEALVRSHRAAFERLARRLARDPEDAEDLLQETLLDAYRGLHTYRAGTQFYSWVARIMTNNHLDRVRRKRHPVVSLDQAASDGQRGPLDLPDETTNPENVILQEHLDDRFHSALEALQPSQRATVLLCDIEGATYEEAARTEECPIGTIRSRLHRAHTALRRFVANFDPAPQPALPVPRLHSRRAFLRLGTAAAAGAAFTQLGDVEEARAAPRAIRVLVWSDGTAPAASYPDGIHEALARGLRGLESLHVRTASIDDPEQGLSADALRHTDVLIWWGDRQQNQVSPGRVALVVRRVRDDGMGLIVTHAGYRSAPFNAILGAGCHWTGGAHDDGSPVDLKVTAPRHPITFGLTGFRIPRTERYEGPFDVPKPDVVVFDGTYEAGGGTAWQGMVWTAGRGRVFYFQPGHEAYPIFEQDEVQQVFRNAAAWCARPTEPPA
jgi:RNA polymerase sigma factor (sigma-70 family)